MIALGIDPDDQSKHWTIYYVVETVREPDGKKVSSYPLSKAFLTKEPAEEAKAALLAEHPGAGVGNFTCVGSPEARALAAQENEE